MPRLRAAAVFLSLAGSAAACWGGEMTPEVCCDTRQGPRGDARCWDGEYTFERCCGAAAPPGAPGPSAEAAALKVDPAGVPSLPLLGGGRMPIVGLGLCCRPTAKGDAVRQGVLDFLLMGGRHLDDATIYGNHREVGLGIRQAVALGVPREEVFLTTKIPPNRFGFEETLAWIPEMLEELGLEYVDLVLLHMAGVPDGAECGEPRACRQETWLALQRARAKGQIRHLGVSNFGPRQMSELFALGGAPIEVNQLEYHPWVPEVHRQAAAWCHERGIAVTAYGSMGSMQLAGQLLTQDALLQVGRMHGKTPGQVLLRWALQQNVSVIPGTGNPRHMAENLGVFDFELGPEALAILGAVPEEARMLHFGHWPDRSP